jgi:hypothetical protein
MHLDVGAVDRRAFGDRTGCRERLDQSDPEPLAGPTVEAVIDCGRRALFLRAVAPPATHLEHVDDARDHPSIIDTPRTALVLGQERSNHSPLFIR